MQASRLSARFRHARTRSRRSHATCLTSPCLDAILSDGPCLELARELRVRGVPFLIYSGASEFRGHAPELEGTPWVEKPAPFEVVLAYARKLLGG